MGGCLWDIHREEFCWGDFAQTPLDEWVELLGQLTDEEVHLIIPGVVGRQRPESTEWLQRPACIYPRSGTQCLLDGQTGGR